MSDEPLEDRLKALAFRLWPSGLGVFVVCAFWAIVVIVAAVATAQSAKPWDTLIAALAMISQAFFAFVVWRLSRTQFAFNQKVAETQHNIDMFPLRKEAARSHAENIRILIYGMSIDDDEIEKFRLSHLEIAKLFSDEAEQLAYDLYECAVEAASEYKKSEPVYTAKGILIPASSESKDKADALVRQALDIATDLEDIIDQEMHIR